MRGDQQLSPLSDTGPDLGRVCRLFVTGNFGSTTVPRS